MKHKRILLVDDDEDDQLIFTDAVTELSGELECLIANNGYEAFDQLKKADPTPSVIFLDLNMPIMNGFEFLELKRSLHHLREIPVVIFTTSSSPVDQKRSEEYGVKSFFTKTSDFNALKNKLSELLDNDMSFT